MKRHKIIPKTDKPKITNPAYHKSGFIIINIIEPIAVIIGATINNLYLSLLYSYTSEPNFFFIINCRTSEFKQKSAKKRYVSFALKN